MKACGIIVAGGSGSRLKASKNKVLLPLLGKPLFLYAVQALLPFCEQVILVTKEEERAEFETILRAHGVFNVTFAPGGAQRRNSVENALKLVGEGVDLVLIHDAARPFPGKDMIQALLDKAAQTGAAIPAVPVTDTLRRTEGERSETISRENLFAVQTPQVFSLNLIKKAYAASPEVTTDDAGLVEKLGHPVALVEGESTNIKITVAEDLAMAEQSMLFGVRVGTGYDVHRLVEGRELILCGVNVPHSLGLLGHSDADVALHALTDALLGACALGDIGSHFPDSKAEYKGVSSLLLLKETARIMLENGFVPWQVDVTLLAQKPKLAPFIPQMRQTIADALNLPLSRVSVKATTTEGLGFEGREEGVSAQAVAMVREIKQI